MEDSVVGSVSLPDRSPLDHKGKEVLDYHFSVVHHFLPAFVHIF